MILLTVACYGSLAIMHVIQLISNMLKIQNNSLEKVRRLGSPFRAGFTEWNGRQQYSDCNLSRYSVDLADNSYVTGMGSGQSAKLVEKLSQSFATVPFCEPHS